MGSTPSLENRFDALIVGGGHNGLVCAAYLAQAGMKVLVVEARAEIFADDPTFVEDPMFASNTASTIGWLTMGESVWLAGRHLPSNESNEVARLVPLAMEFVKDVVISLLSRRPG